MLPAEADGRSPQIPSIRVSTGTVRDEAASNMAARYESMGPIVCSEHPEAESSIEVQAVFQSSVKVRRLKFCCQALADLVDERIAQLNG